MLYFFPTQIKTYANLQTFYVYFLVGQSVLATPLLMCSFCMFERCLDSNPESCRSKQVLYQLSHPSPYLGEFANLLTSRSLASMAAFSCSTVSFFLFSSSILRASFSFPFFSAYSVLIFVPYGTLFNRFPQISLCRRMLRLKTGTVAMLCALRAPTCHAPIWL